MNLKFLHWLNSPLLRYIHCNFCINLRISVWDWLINWAGDLNLPHIDWGHLTCPPEYVHSTVFEFIIKHGFSQFVTFCNRQENILDVILCDDDLLITRVAPHPSVGHSDHYCCWVCNLCRSVQKLFTCYWYVLYPSTIGQKRILMLCLPIWQVLTGPHCTPLQIPVLVHYGVYFVRVWVLL